LHHVFMTVDCAAATLPRCEVMPCRINRYCVAVTPAHALRKSGVPDLRGKRRTYGDRKVGALS
jgi:hypothetical protein